MANKNIRVTELDFDTIKTNLKDFLRSQTAFSDYDFEGSNLSVLIDLLAYNTHYNAVLANMVNNEMFLDTALKRGSVVSLAKHLSYTPRSVRSATALVDIELRNVTGSPNFVTLDRYKLFTTIVDGEALTFYNTESYVATPVNGVYTFSDVTLYQGRQLDYFFTVATPGPAEKYVIPNQNVDTRTVQVAVQYTGTSSYSQSYTLVDDIVDIQANTNAYFLEENAEGFFQIYFGDGVVGRKLTAGDIVKISYITSDGAAGNVSTNASVPWSCSTIAGEDSVDRNIFTTSKPAGGGDRETIDEIRFNATGGYVTQGRAVTDLDYATLVLNQLPAARSVNVWGGERNTPPEYGIVYISVSPKTGYVLTEAEKTRIIEDILKPNSLVTMRHAFVDPEYTYLTLRIAARYSTAGTNRSAAQISSLVNDKVTSFIDTNLKQFNRKFYQSQLHEQLMDLDDSILSITINKRLQKRFTPNVNSTLFSGDLKFTTKIHPGDITSSNFAIVKDTVIYTVNIQDSPDQMPPDYNGTGTLNLINAADNSILTANIGTVNYGTGVINISGVDILGYIGGVNYVSIYIEPQEEDTTDVVPGYNEILLLDDNVASTVANIENGIIIDTIGSNT